jgi:chorismate synthase
MIGERFVAMSFGESHGRCVGIIVDGCPAGLPLGEADIQRPKEAWPVGHNYTTKRRRQS